MPWRHSALLLLAALALGAAGCKKEPVQAAPPVDTAPTPAETELKPPETGTSAEPAALPEPVAPEPAKPEPSPPTPRARTTPPPEPEAEPQPSVPPPRISPRLSPAEQADYERRTNAAIAVAEKNLQTAYSKKLNSAQHDLVQKVRGFLAQAREAIRAGDWMRAYSLAQKAEVLSSELVNSL